MTASLDTGRMQEAVQLARLGEGCTRPNPPVGAVIYRGSRRVGAGFHRRAGEPHAEIHALREAGPRARGATLYVTLEPCSTIGRTGACTDAILAAGIGRVVVGAVDPNPAHAGRGLRILRTAGLAVTRGVAQSACRELIAPFRQWIRHGTPYLTLKLALSLDGRIADREGQSRWITSSASRQYVQSLRRAADAIMVGAGTLRADNPVLLPRPARGRQPLRVVVAGREAVPREANVFLDAAASRTLVVAPHAHHPRWAGFPGEVLPVEEASDGRVNVRALLASLGQRGVLHVLCEGGGELAASLVRAGLVHRYELALAPCFIGAGRSRPALGGPGWLMGQLPRVRFLRTRRIGADLWIQAQPIQPKE